MPQGEPRHSGERQDPYLAELIRRCRTRPHHDGRNYSMQSVADRLWISLGTYDSIERGYRRLRHDHANLLHHLANDLGMDDGERRSLFHLSGLPIPQRPSEEETYSGELEAHCRIAAALPPAAMVQDFRSNIVFVNRTFRSLFPNVGEGDNFVRWVLTDPAARRELVNWLADWALPILQYLKTKAAEGHDEGVIAFYRELSHLLDIDEPAVGRHSPNGQLQRKLVGARIVTLRAQPYTPSSEVPSQYMLVVFEVYTDWTMDEILRSRQAIGVSRDLQRRVNEILKGHWHNAAHLRVGPRLQCLST